MHFLKVCSVGSQIRESSEICQYWLREKPAYIRTTLSASMSLRHFSHYQSGPVDLVSFFIDLGGMYLIHKLVNFLIQTLWRLWKLLWTQMASKITSERQLLGITQTHSAFENEVRRFLFPSLYHWMRHFHHIKLQLYLSNPIWERAVI